MFLQQSVNALTLGSIYALIALGYTLVYGILGMINFAHSEVLMLGAFSAFALSRRWPTVADGPFGIAALFICAMAGAAAVNYSIERLVYRRLRRAPRLAPLICAIGASLVLQNGVFLWVSTQSETFPQPAAATTWKIFGAQIGALQVGIIFAALFLMLALEFFIKKTSLGKALRACADDMEAATLMGVDANTAIAATFIVGGALGGAAGVLYGMNYGSIKYSMGFLPGAKAFTAAVLGGIGDVRGAVLGGMILGFLEVFAAGYVPGGAEWRDVIAFGALIAVLLWRPAGLLGSTAAEKV